jgi:hypothetical protein
MALNVPQAVRLIPYYANSVGWRDDWGRICRLVGFNIAPADPAIFVTAVYQWQRTHQIDADGMVGADTWKRMKPMLPSSYVGPIPAWAAALDIPEIKVFILSKENRTEFLERCHRAHGKVQTASLQFSAWLSGIAFAYGAAFEAHESFLKSIESKVKLADDMIFGAALAFLGGGVGVTTGNWVKAVMKRLEMSSDFVVDGIKDLAKFAVRTPTGQVLRAPSLKVMPQSPNLWQNAINERVMNEMAEVSKKIDDWNKAVDEGDVTFDAAFDPVTVVDNALVLHVPDPLPVMHLPAVDKDALQADYEKGFLVAWIKLGEVKHTPHRRAITRDGCVAYGRKLGIANIVELVDEYMPNEENPMTRGVGVITPL